MPKPLKNMMPEFSKLEKFIELAIQVRFDLHAEYWPTVKYFDQCLLKAEKMKLFPDDREQWYGFSDLPNVDIEVAGWTPAKASRKF
jgi:hypothetical protein